MLARLPNPDEPAEGPEQVTIENGTAEEANYVGWILRDHARSGS